MNRYDIALGKVPPIGFRILHRFYNRKLLDALCETGKDPLIMDMALFEKHEGTDLSFWYKCMSNEEPNEMGKKLMSIRNVEQFKRRIDRSVVERMAKAANIKV